jgi:quercetin dioxygenase-like cupin family protein
MPGFALGRGEGHACGFHGAAVVIKAAGSDTAGQLAVMESVYPAGLRVHEHVHAGEDEMFYLLDGELDVFCADSRWAVAPGGFVLIPRDQPHGFVVTSSRPARALVITGPPSLDRQIAERGETPPADFTLGWPA